MLRLRLLPGSNLPSTHAPHITHQDSRHSSYPTNYLIFPTACVSVSLLNSWLRGTSHCPISVTPLPQNRRLSNPYPGGIRRIPGLAMFKNLRSFLSYSRIPLRIAARQDGHKLYRVRVVPQRKRVHTYLRSLLIFGGFHVAASIMLETFTSKREGPLFVPIIPIWFAKEEHQEKYETSSPEFQVFVSFSQDKNKHDIVRSESCFVLSCG